MAVRFLHAADLHLGSPLSGLAGRDPVLAALFERATWRAFEAVVDLALAEAVAFVVVAGDVFDRDWKDWSTGQAFVRQMGRLARAGIRTVLIRGNHDAESVISRQLPLPDGIVWLGADRPETIDWPDLGVAVHGMSFKTAAVADALVDRYPPPLPGRFNIGLLHTSLDGRPDVSRYAPCAVSDLLVRGYDYWALGHVHVREVVRAEAPTVVFPGNIQGRSIRETGAKGVTLVTVDGTAVRLDHRDTDRARWALVDVEATGAADAEALAALLRPALAAPLAAAGDRPLAVRIRITGTTAADALLRADPARLHAELQAAATALSDRVAIEKIRLETRSPDGRPALSAIEDLDAALTAAADDPALRAAMAADGALIRSKLPPGAADLLEADDDRILAAARGLILAALAGDG